MAALRILLACIALGGATALVMTPGAAPALRARTASSPTVQMVDAGHAVDAATQLMALQIPIAAFSPAKVRAPRGRCARGAACG